MSAKYDNYIENHVKNVEKAYNYIHEKLPRYCEFGPEIGDWDIKNHDRSKLTKEEYEAYDNWFYGNKTFKAKTEFDKAWLHHIHNNPHHWQYYILREDNPKEEIGGTDTSLTWAKSAIDSADIDDFNMFSEYENNNFYTYVGVKILEMPDNYILEMVCDWWSFSWKEGNLFEVFDWYDAHKNRIQLHPKTREKVEKLLGEIKQTLEKFISEKVIERAQGIR